MARKGKLKLKTKKEKVTRPLRLKQYQYLFLIVCEDQKTEPSYFGEFQKQIPQDTLYLKPVGTGLDPLGVVKKAIQEKQDLEELAKREVDCVWVVFDKDDADENNTKTQKFTEALKIAKKHSFKVAYSNEVFELWLLIHFIDVDENKPLPRKEVYDLLRTEFKKVPGYASYTYDHYKPDPKTIEIVLKAGDQDKAKSRAESLLAHHSKKAPIDANPSTRVHLLRGEIQEWIEYFSFKPD